MAGGKQESELSMEYLADVEALLASEDNFADEAPIQSQQRQKKQFQTESDLEGEQEEEQQQDSHQEEQEQEEGEGDEPEQPKYKVKVAGEETEVSLEELLNGYQRQSDYTRKTMELSEQRKALEAEIQKTQEVEQVRNAYLTKLNEIEQFFTKPAISQDKLLEILHNDGTEAYLEAKLREDQRVQNLNTVREEQLRIAREQEQVFVQNWQRQRLKALDEIPEFKDNAYYNKVKEFVGSVGVNPKDLDSLTDVGALKIVQLAMEGAELKKAKDQLLNKKAAPAAKQPLVSTTHAKANQAQRDEFNRKFNSVRKNGGDTKDIAELLAYVMN